MNTPYIPCSAKTTKGDPCSIHADRYHNGKTYCHVHDPDGVYQQQQQGEKFIKDATSKLPNVLTINGIKYKRCNK